MKRSNRIFEASEREFQELEWIASTAPVGPRLFEDDDVIIVPKHARASITLSLVPLICLTLIVAGISSWAIMYALNEEGLNAASLSVQQQSLNNVLSVIRDFNTPFVYAVQTMEEFLRAMERRNPGFVDNAENWILTAFVLARQFGGSCVCGRPNGALDGFRSSSNLTVQRLWTDGNGTLFTYRADEFGGVVELVSVEHGFNVTERDWYRGARERGGFFQTDVHVYAGTEGVGFTYAIALLADLDPPRFALGRAPLTSRDASLVSREVLAVCGVDGKLSDLSQRLSLRKVGTSGRALVFFFTNTGFFAGSSDPSIPFKTGFPARPILVTELNHTLLNATMAFLLDRNGVPHTAYFRYNEVRTMENVFVSLDGESRIVSVTRYVNVDNTTSFYAVLVTPSSDYFATSDRATLVSLLVIFLGVVPVLLAFTAVCLHFSLSKPASMLADAMLGIAQNFSFNHPQAAVSRIKEVEIMQRSFDSMQRALKAFGKFTPVEVVRGLLKTRKEATVGVEEVSATAQFSDIEGFTSISERVSSQQLIKAMEEYFDAMTEIIESMGGTVGDFIGDAIFSFFNAPSPIGPRHAFLCVAAAVKMQEALTRLREDWARRGLPEFRVRIGINSGRCLAGNVGSRSRLKFTLLGDEINLAARLESLCKQYGCYLVISESTFKEPDVADKFCCRVIDRVAVVGKSKATVVREVLARRHEATENQLLLERLSNRMMEELTGNEIDKCADTLREMDLLKPDDLAIKKVSARVARFQAAPYLEKWSSVEYLLEK